jgi:hypothetical protein
MGVMAFNDGGHISLRTGRSRSNGNLEKDVHSDGEVRAVKDRRLLFAGLFFQAWDMLIPTGGADDDRLASVNAGFDVFDDRFRRGEIDQSIDSMQMIRAQRSGVRILLGREHADRVSALSRYFLNQRSGFSMAQ